MKSFFADLHVHTLLSPCGDLEMTPREITESALKKGLSLIAITDHNSTRMCEQVAQYAQTRGLVVLPGVEVTSQEEVHAICLFPDFERTDQFQQILDRHLLKVKNNPKIFGDQVVIDPDENILYIERYSLLTSLDLSVKEIEKEVHRIGGLFIPAHVYRRQNGLVHQLGWIPADLDYDALEMTPGSSYLVNPIEIRSDRFWIHSSDAHYPEHIGKFRTEFWMEEVTFDELKMALFKEKGRVIKYSQNLH